MDTRTIIFDPNNKNILAELEQDYQHELKLAEYKQDERVVDHAYHVLNAHCKKISARNKLLARFDLTDLKKGQDPYLEILQAHIKESTTPDDTIYYATKDVEEEFLQLDKHNQFLFRTFLQLFIQVGKDYGKEYATLDTSSLLSIQEQLTVITEVIESSGSRLPFHTLIIGKHNQKEEYDVTLLQKLQKQNTTIVISGALIPAVPMAPDSITKVTGSQGDEKSANHHTLAKASKDEKSKANRPKIHSEKSTARNLSLGLQQKIATQLKQVRSVSLHSIYRETGKFSKDVVDRNNLASLFTEDLIAAQRLTINDLAVIWDNLVGQYSTLSPNKEAHITHVRKNTFIRVVLNRVYFRLGLILDNKPEGFYIRLEIENSKERRVLCFDPLYLSQPTPLSTCIPSSVPIRNYQDIPFNTNLNKYFKNRSLLNNRLTRIFRDFGPVALNEFIQRLEGIAKDCWSLTALENEEVGHFLNEAFCLSLMNSKEALLRIQELKAMITSAQQPKWDLFNIFCRSHFKSQADNFFALLKGFTYFHDKITHYLGSIVWQSSLVRHNYPKDFSMLIFMDRFVRIVEHSEHPKLQAEILSNYPELLDTSAAYHAIRYDGFKLVTKDMLLTPERAELAPKMRGSEEEKAPDSGKHSTPIYTYKVTLDTIIALATIHRGANKEGREQQTVHAALYRYWAQHNYHLPYAHFREVISQACINEKTVELSKGKFIQDKTYDHAPVAMLALTTVLANDNPRAFDLDFTYYAKRLRELLSTWPNASSCLLALIQEFKTDIPTPRFDELYFVLNFVRVYVQKAQLDTESVHLAVIHHIKQCCIRHGVTFYKVCGALAASLQNRPESIVTLFNLIMPTPEFLQLTVLSMNQLMYIFAMNVDSLSNEGDKKNLEEQLARLQRKSHSIFSDFLQALSDININNTAQKPIHLIFPTKLDIEALCKELLSDAERLDKIHDKKAEIRARILQRCPHAVYNIIEHGSTTLSKFSASLNKHISQIIEKHDNEVKKILGSNYDHITRALHTGDTNEKAQAIENIIKEITKSDSKIGEVAQNQSIFFYVVPQSSIQARGVNQILSEVVRVNIALLQTQIHELVDTYQFDPEFSNKLKVWLTQKLCSFNTKNLKNNWRNILKDIYAATQLLTDFLRAFNALHQFNRFSAQRVLPLLERRSVLPLPLITLFISQSSYWTERTLEKGFSEMAALVAEGSEKSTQNLEHAFRILDLRDWTELELSACISGIVELSALPIILDTGLLNIIQALLSACREHSDADPEQNHGSLQRTFDAMKAIYAQAHAQVEEKHDQASNRVSTYFNQSLHNLQQSLPRNFNHITVVFKLIEVDVKFTLSLCNKVPSEEFFEIVRLFLERSKVNQSFIEDLKEFINQTKLESNNLKAILALKDNYLPFPEIKLVNAHLKTDLPYTPINITTFIERYAKDPYAKRSDLSQADYFAFNVDELERVVSGLECLNDNAAFTPTIKEQLRIDARTIQKIGEYGDPSAKPAIKAYKDLTLAELKETAVELIKSSAEEDTTPGSCNDSRIKLLALCREVMYRTTGMFPYTVHIITVLLTEYWPDKHIFLQKRTGEGKSIVDALLRIMQWSDTRTTVYGANSNLTWAKRDQRLFKNFIDFFTTHQVIVDAEAQNPTLRIGGINYADWVNFSHYHARIKANCETRRISPSGIKCKPVIILSEADKILDITSDAIQGHCGTLQQAGPTAKYWLEVYTLINTFSDAHVEPDHNLEHNTESSRAMRLQELKKFLFVEPKTFISDAVRNILSNITDDQFDEWLDSARDIHKLWQENKTQPGEYFLVVQTNIKVNDKMQAFSKVIVVDDKDPTTAIYSRGGHQLLVARLHALRNPGDPEFLLEPEVKTTSMETIKNFMDYFRKKGRIIGTTATLGSELEIAELDKKYNCLCIAIPTRAPCKVKIMPTEYCQTTADFHKNMKAICLKRDQPILIDVSSIQAAKELAEYFRRQKLRKNTRLLLLTAENIEDTEKMIRKAGHSKTIMISTLARRQMDIVTTHPEGLLTIATDFMLTRDLEQLVGNGTTSISGRDSKQLFGGRSARNKSPGAVITVLDLERIEAKHGFKVCGSNRAKTDLLIKNLRAKIERERSVERRIKELVGDIKNAYYQQLDRWLKFLSIMSLRDPEVRSRVLALKAAFIQKTDLLWDRAIDPLRSSYTNIYVAYNDSGTLRCDHISPHIRQFVEDCAQEWNKQEATLKSWVMNIAQVQDFAKISLPGNEKLLSKVSNAPKLPEISFDADNELTVQFTAPMPTRSTLSRFTQFSYRAPALELNNIASEASVGIIPAARGRSKQFN